jgi:Flp pilus assembly pilin Flp
MLTKMLASESGQGLLEYTVIVSFMAIAVFGVLVLLGQQLHNSYQNDLNQTASVW